MVTIETENGRFEGETIRDAKRAADKAAREARKRAAVIDAIRRRAQEEAEAQGFRMLRMKHARGSFPGGWRFLPAGRDGDLSAVKVLPKSSGADVAKIQIDTADGRGVVEQHCKTVFGYIESGAGFAVAVVVDSMYEATPKVCAVGVNDGEAWYEEVPGVRPEEFNNWRA